MRTWIPLLLVLGTAVGCTPVQLRHSTVGQIRTLTELQHKLVLDNLAAFSCNSEAIPFQANLTGGVTQITDSGAASYVTQVAAATFGVSRSVVDQWNVTPVTDEITLRLLRIAYRRALGFDEDLYTEDLANRVAHRLKAQISSAPDVSVENTYMFSRGPALPQLLDRPGWKGGTQLGFSGDDPTVQRWIKDTTDIIASNSERIIQVGERLTEQTLTVTPVYVRGAPFVVPGEAAPRVLIATPYATEIRRQVLALNDYLLQIQPGWLNHGDHKDVPKCVCYVGHHKECGCNCWAWVGPDERAAFEDFTLRTLRLTSLIEEPATNQVQGVTYSPTVTR